MSQAQVQILQKARNAFASGQSLSYSFRIQQLKNMLRLLDDGKDEILDALKADLRKSALEGTVYEIEVLRADLHHLIRHLKDYMKAEKLPVNLLSHEDRGYIQRDPYGVVLVLGAWNYPFGLTLQPLAGAIAAGNCVIVKPSECAPQSASVMAKLIPRYLNQECIHVIEADLEGTKELLKNKFDYIFATGSTQMGRSVMAAAAPHLTPVTLELGGKSPTYIDDSSDFTMAAKRILWGKCMNLGQTCIAPDYILCSKAVEKEFVKVASQVLVEWYGNTWKNSPDLPRIVNDRNFQRLQKILSNTKGRVAFGGETDAKERWVAPTILVDVDISDAVMEEEIFGPILPILTIGSPDAAIRLINSRPKPLALYVFSKDDSVIQKFLQKTSSGGVCINDVIWHNGLEGLPFGGVGDC